MRELFISDLDGTLFNSDAEITDFTAETINSLISHGLNFTFATARSQRSAIELTEKLNLNVPCVMMNGVVIYNTTEKRFEKIECISMEYSLKLCDAFEKCGVKGHIYRISDGNLIAFTDKENDDFSRYTYRRSLREALSEDTENLPIYFTATDEREILLPLKNEADRLNGADCAFYEDIYTKKWYLEIFSENASKANAVRYLREKYHFDKVTAFGDNLNDISLFSVSDVKIAVGNAKDELKERADIIIESNDSDGVAKWLKENCF